MHWLSRFLAALLLLSISAVVSPISANDAPLAEKVELLFSYDRDLADVKLSVDAIANPAVDVAAGRKAIDELTLALRQMAAGTHTSLEKLTVLTFCL